MLKFSAMNQIIEPLANAPDVWELLLLADPSREAVEEYLHAGQGFMIRSDDGKPWGVIVISPSATDELEIMNVAVAPEVEGQGYGQQLLTYVENYARQQGYSHLRIATANSSLRQLKIYQRAGFDMDRLVPNHFLTHDYPPDLSEDGIPTRHRIELVKHLT